MEQGSRTHEAIREAKEGEKMIATRIVDLNGRRVGVIRQNRSKGTVWATLDLSGHVVEWELSDAGWYDNYVWIDGRRYGKGEAYSRFIRPMLQQGRN